MVFITGKITITPSILKRETWNDREKWTCDRDLCSHEFQVGETIYKTRAGRFYCLSCFFAEPAEPTTLKKWRAILVKRLPDGTRKYRIQLLPV